MDNITLSILELLSQPWHWAFSGFVIALILLVSTWAGKSFGVSSSYKVLCTIAGAGKRLPFFNLNMKEEYWRISFAIGAIVGGIIGSQFLGSDAPVAISQATIDDLASNFHMTYPKNISEGTGFIPEELYNFSNPKGIFLAIIGGIFVGFGARYGEGCTSGHAITGLSHLQKPSLVTVIGFFIGGLIMTHLILPLILG